MAIGSTTAPGSSNVGTNPYDDWLSNYQKTVKAQNAANQSAWQNTQPLFEGNQQSNFVPLNKTAFNINNQTQARTQTPAQAGNAAVLGQMQNLALNQPQSSVLPLVTQQTAKLLSDPMQGYDPAGYKQMQLDQYNRGASQAMEAARQKLGDTSQSGQLQQEFLKNALDVEAGRGDLGRQMDYDAYKQRQEATLKALGEGRATVGTENQAFTSMIQNLGATRAAAEGEEERTTQKDIVEIQGKIDMGKLLTTQDWQGVQNDLDRLLKKYTAEGDWASVFQVEKSREDFELLKQKKDQEQQTRERVADQIWATGERLGDQEYKKDMADLAQKNALAIQAGDIQGQKELIEKKGLLDLKMQTQDMDHEEKMAYLNNNLAEARANNDVERQKTILKFQHGNEMEILAAKYGYDKALIYARGEIDKAINAGDHVAAETLLKLELTSKADQADKDRVLKKAELELEKRGIDMKAIESQYNMILDSGDAEAATRYINQTLSDAGLPNISIAAPDAKKAARAAVEADFDAAKYQWGLTHPDPKYVTGNGDLTDEGKKAFYSEYNSAISGKSTASIENLIDGIANNSALRGGAKEGSKNNAAYNDALGKATEWKPQMTYDSRGFWLPDERKFSNPPAKNEVFRYNGKLYQTISDVSMDSKGENSETFKVIDVDTGETKNIRINGTGGKSLSIKGF